MSDLRPRTFIGPEGPPVTRLVRHFKAGGDDWTVYEDERSISAINRPTLVFESDRVARRVHQYPANWRDLPDEELHVLSWSR